jgi:hypothetical protein
METSVNVLIFRDCEWWVAQCLEYDIAAQARTIKDVEYEFQRVFIGRIAAAKQLGIGPFEGISPAPKEYHKVVEDTDKTLRVEFKPIKNLKVKIPPAFMLPKEAVLYAD